MNFGEDLHLIARYKYTLYNKCNFFTLSISQGLYGHVPPFTGGALRSDASERLARPPPIIKVREEQRGT